MKQPVLGMVASQFPETHETFVLRELLALVEAGVSLRIYSLKRCRDRVVQEAARPLLPRTTTVAWDDFKTWGSALWVFFRRPGQGVAALRQAARFSGFSALAFFKTLVVWVQAMALSERVRGDGVTHIHAHWATAPTTAAAMVSRWLEVPFSFTAHAWDIFVRNPSLKEKIRRAVRVITCTEYNRRYLAQVCPEAAGKIVLNYHGVDVRQFAGSPVFQFASSRDNRPTGQPANRLTPLFLSIGRLVETKGFDTLLEAYRILKGRGTPFRSVIVGEGPLRNRLKREIQNLRGQTPRQKDGGQAKGSDPVVLKPTMQQSELKVLYEQADAFVLPSRIARNGDRDGIPNVILEAMAMGLPVVSTRISGIQEAVVDGETGLLVPPDDSKALADALERLVREPGLSATLGANGRARVTAEFSEKRHMTRLVEQMREFLEGSASRSQRVRVMFLIWSLEIGGAERVVAALARGLDRRRFAPIVVCLNGPGRLANVLEQEGVPVIALHKRPGLDLGILWKLVRLMRGSQTEIVHTHLWGAGFWGRLAAKMAGVPVVIAHEHGMQPWRGSLHFWIDRWLGGWTDRILFASKEVMRMYRERTEISADKCQWVPNGVEVLQFSGSSGDYFARQESWRARNDEKVFNRPTGQPANPLTLLSIGRLAPEKGHADLLKAFTLVLLRIPQARMVLVGDGPERVRLRQLQEELRLDGQVTFAGVQEDVVPWLRGADLYVQPSRREGLSLAVLEAMAAGRPVVVTDVGGNREAVEDGVTGVVVPPGDPAALAEGMLKILRDPTLASRMGQAGRARAEEDFSVDAMVRANERVYEDLVERECA